MNEWRMYCDAIDAMRETARLVAWAEEVETKKKELENSMNVLEREDFEDGQMSDEALDKVVTTGSAWIQRGDAFSPAKETKGELPVGIYSVNVTPEGVFFVPHEDYGDSLFHWKDGPTDQVLSSMNVFWQSKGKYDLLGITRKRGILLHGPAGSGKTSTLRAVADMVMKQYNGVVLMDPDLGDLANGLRVIRKMERDRPLVVLMEDLNQVAERQNQVLLGLLDGEYQVDNVVFLATSNNPERLHENLVNRPSRFDVQLYIGAPEADARRLYLQDRTKHIAGFWDAHPLNDWVRDTKGFMIAHLKELLVSTVVFDYPYKEVCTRLNDMMNGKSKFAPTSIVNEDRNTHI